MNIITINKIYFDMDGTIADFYGVEGWLDDLRAENTRPYAEARPLVNMNSLARLLNKLIGLGYEINIISWTSRNGSAEYNSAVANVKRAWLRRHLRSVHFEEIHIIPYRKKKSSCGKGFLFDDEEPNRKEWGEYSFPPEEIFEVLRGLI